MRSILVAMVAVVVAGCGAGTAKQAAKYDDATSSDVTAAKYESAIDYLDSTGGDSGGFYDLTGNLNNAFANICGDTFCGGDYNPIQPLTLTCSVAIKDGTIHQCLWTFAGAYDTIAKTTGNITNHNKIWKCSLPVTGKIGDLITLLNAPGNPDALHRTLPSGGTVYDALGTCLTGT